MHTKTRKQNKQANKQTHKKIPDSGTTEFSLSSSGVTPSASSPGVDILAEALS
jgi:hypothetical protein